MSLKISEAFGYFGGDLIEQNLPEKLKGVVSNMRVGFDATKNAPIVIFETKSGKVHRVGLDKVLAESTAATIVMLEGSSA